MDLERKSSIQWNAQQILLGKKTNVLLVKDDVGRAKPTTRNLPSDHFVFGKPDMLPNRETAEDGKDIWAPLRNPRFLKLLRFSRRKVADAPALYC